ncbi:MAG: hypothetical protein ACK4VN_06805 [Bacteroidales bacterium]
MYQKFIINQERLKLAIVDQHRYIAEDHSTTRGGGWWHMDVSSRKIWLYGRSIEFGRVTVELLTRIIRNGNHDYPDFTFLFSTSERLDDALLTARVVG